MFPRQDHCTWDEWIYCNLTCSWRNQRRRWRRWHRTSHLTSCSLWLFVAFLCPCNRTIFTPWAQSSASPASAFHHAMSSSSFLPCPFLCSPQPLLHSALSKDVTHFSGRLPSSPSSEVSASPRSLHRNQSCCFFYHLYVSHGSIFLSRLTSFQGLGLLCLLHCYLQELGWCDKYDLQTLAGAIATNH